MIRAHVSVVTSAQKDASVFLDEWRFLSADRRAQIAARRDAYEALFRNAIADGIQVGVFDAVDVRITATAILSALNGIASWYRAGGPLSADEVADSYAALFLKALREPHFMTRTIT